MRASRRKTLRLAIMIAALPVAGLGQTCESYRKADTRLEVFDMPDTGNGLAIAMLPAGAAACIVESQTDGYGQTWDRVKFYLLENEKHTTPGWIVAEPDAAEEAPAAAESTPSDQGEQVAVAAPPTTAEDGDNAEFFAASWTLDPQQSTFNFLSTKKGTVTEVHRFEMLSGHIDPDGTAEVAIDLESVNSGIDIRDVRMRFLFFKTHEYPEAIITAKIDPESVEQLWSARRMLYDLPVSISLHGHDSEMVVPVVISRLGGDMVSIASALPVLVNLADFALQDGLAELAVAAGNIVISPLVPVSFNLTFVVGASG